MAHNNHSLEILQKFIEKNKELGLASVVQGVFDSGQSRSGNLLYSKTFPVTLEHKPYLNDYYQIMSNTRTYETGIGLASPQLGVPLQIFIIGMDGKAVNQRYGKGEEVPLQFFANPRITKVSTELKSFWHGCLSAKEQKLGKVATYDWLEFEAYDLELNKFEGRIEGMGSIIFQHEFRHLLGKLCLDQTHIVLEREALQKKISEGEIKSCEPCGLEVPHLLEDYKVGTFIEE